MSEYVKLVSIEVSECIEEQRHLLDFTSKSVRLK